MKTGWRDRNGLAFADYRLHVPIKHGEPWPKPEILKDGPSVAAYRQQFDRCAMCGRSVDAFDTEAKRHVAGQVHHIVGGPRKSDAWWNLIVLCNSFGGCHEMVQSQRSMLRLVLAAKWLADRENTDWVALATLYGKHLPDPEWPEYWRLVRAANLRR